MSLRYLMKIEGLPGRFNNIIHVSSCQQQQQNKYSKKWTIVCYFGGDIQNFSEKMIQCNNQEFLDYSLENVAEKLSQRFTQDDIVVFQPSSIIESFSRYENFVKSIDQLGTPRFDVKDRSCYDHLLCLLTNIDKQVNSENRKEHIEAKLIAFSKGQVVINQLARSIRLIKYNNIDQERRPQLKLTDIYMLDGGHNGQHDIWITDPELIDSLINHGGCQQFHLGITDFQLKKSQRIRDEERQLRVILASKFSSDSMVNSTNSTPKVKRTYLSQKDYQHLSLIQLHFKLLDFLFEGRL